MRDATVFTIQKFYSTGVEETVGDIKDFPESFIIKAYLGLKKQNNQNCVPDHTFKM